MLKEYQRYIKKKLINLLKRNMPDVKNLLLADLSYYRIKKTGKLVIRNKNLLEQLPKLYTDNCIFTSFTNASNLMFIHVPHLISARYDFD